MLLLVAIDRLIPSGLGLPEAYHRTGRLGLGAGTGGVSGGGSGGGEWVSVGWGGSWGAGGGYRQRAGRAQAVVVSERNGAWRKAIEVPGSGALNAGGSAQVNSVSCALAG